ncbi:MAG: hypothetical protein AB1515_09205 [Nitrospirota bacterium]
MTRTRIMSWAIAAALALLAVGVALKAGPFRDGLELAAADRSALAELVLSAVEAPDERTAPGRDAVWTILRRRGTPTAGDRRELEARFLAIGRGPRLFWLDAQRALKAERPVKSAERTQWEAELLGDGWLTMAQQRRYDEFMGKIARREPIESSHGVEILVDEAMAQAILDSLSDAELRATVTALLTPP